MLLRPDRGVEDQLVVAAVVAVDDLQKGVRGSRNVGRRLPHTNTGGRDERLQRGMTPVFVDAATVSGARTDRRGDDIWRRTSIFAQKRKRRGKDLIILDLTMRLVVDVAPDRALAQLAHHLGASSLARGRGEREREIW